ncbi:Transposon TX1 uncharacterized 149 kDa protein [Vitis vinifera]|uniref:Transposon TX1 uncharacterized 149 kDa protein n=1 Tax=Vitis vinifera TaxID=29760 RepID=A0A438KCI1_VITVI|nr:Transposon TX1 uncharacterized 149 kDa protein [Vitis vinifera]
MLIEEITPWIRLKSMGEDQSWKSDIEGLQLNSLNHAEAEGLEQPFTEAEIHLALMGMNGDKAPGPDGFTVAFWQFCWEFVKEEIVDVFKEFYEDKPISLLGGVYKLLAKVLSNRIKKVLDKVVSPDQNAFVKGRQILDASLIANEGSLNRPGLRSFYPQTAHPEPFKPLGSLQGFQNPSCFYTAGSK